MTLKMIDVNFYFQLSLLNSVKRYFMINVFSLLCFQKALILRVVTTLWSSGGQKGILEHQTGVKVIWKFQHCRWN